MRKRNSTMATRGKAHKILNVGPIDARPLNAKPIRAILLDADNTIFKTKKAAKEADMAAMKVLSKQLKAQPSKLYSEWSSLVQDLKKSCDPKKRLRKYSYALLTKKHKFPSRSLIDEAYDSFVQALMKNIRIEPSFKKLLAAAKGIKLLLITEAPKDLTMHKLEKFGLKNKFYKIITSDDIGRMKPDKKYYDKAFLALKKAGIRPDECLAIGDDFEKDLLMPKKLGAATVIFSSSDSRADYSIASHAQLVRLIKRK